MPEENIGNIFQQHELCKAMRLSGQKFTDTKVQLEVLESYILSKVNAVNIDTDSLELLRSRLASFLSHAIKKYRQANSSFQRFLESKSNSEFLENIFPIPESWLSENCENIVPEKKKIRLQKVGRKELPFDEKSTRGKQQASAKIRELHEAGAITLAASQSKTPLGKLIRKSNSPSGSTSHMLLSTLTRSPSPSLTKKSPTEALAFLLQNDLTKDQYINIKIACKQSGADIWPGYDQLKEAKKSCRPEGIITEELQALVPLQSLLDHTAGRLLQHNPVINVLTEGKSKIEIELLFKYGFDGCGSFATFMQKDSKGAVPDGSTIMASQLVPLQAFLKDKPDIVVFKSDAPNSANSCRPIRLAYQRETKEAIADEADRLKSEVEELQPFLLQENPEVVVHYKGLLTLVDGKVLKELTNAPSASSCLLCHQSYAQIAKQEGVFIPKEGTLEYGASILHFGIRAFEALLHIAYKQDVKKSRAVLTAPEKQLVADRERQVKASFQAKLGLIVDQRRDGGAGNTTTGNVARKAFADPETTAQICNVPVQLVKNLSTIWGALACGFDIDPDKFGQLCDETVAIYFNPSDGVGWFHMPSTLHKVLKHGKDIVMHCPLPIGLTNEEPSESNNKVLRSFRLHHTRKTSWSDQMADLFHRLLDISDPVIQSTKSSFLARRRNKQTLSSEILAVLKNPSNY